MDAPALLRRLHACPESSGHEARTADELAAFLTDAGLEVQRGLGGHGLLVTLGDPPYRLLRADIDALPAADGARHGCGHDGHMTMLAVALARMHAAGVTGVAGLFQPSEEDGTGMARCLQDPRLQDLDVLAAFAIHNIPGVPLGTVEVGPGALASIGIRIRLDGREAHAASPQEGHSPYPALRTLADAVPNLADGLGPHALATLIHVRLGQEAYGTSPGDGVVAVTLRGTDEDVAAMRDRWLDLLPNDLTHTVEDVDPFPACTNTEVAVQAVASAAQEADLPVRRREAPYPWSEDMGHALATWGGALIGLGAGDDQPPLHDDAYAFPEALLEPGIRFWCQLGGMP